MLLSEISRRYRYRHIYLLSLYLFSPAIIVAKQSNNPEDTSRNNLVSSSDMSLTVMKINLNLFLINKRRLTNSNFLYRQGSDTLVGFRQALWEQFHIGILVGLSAKHAHLYQELSLHETGFRNGFYRIETIFVFLTVLIQYVFNLILHIYPTLL